MKKIIVLIIFFSVIPFTAFAISGACSSHGGVNCSTKDPATGNSICNDGFKSSTSFSQTDECRSACIPPIVSGCTNESQLNAVKSQAMKNGGEYNPTGYAAAVQRCENQITQYQANSLAYQTCLLNSSESSQTSNQSSVQEQAMTAAQQKIKSFCDMNYKTHYDFDSANLKCACQVGYRLSVDANGKIYGCVTPQDYCNNMSKNTIYNSTTDECDLKPVPITENQTALPVIPQSPAITQQPKSPSSDIPSPTVKKNVTENPVESLTEIQGTQKQEPTTTQAQPQLKTQTKPNNIFSNIWNFIKNIFKFNK